MSTSRINLFPLLRWMSEMLALRVWTELKCPESSAVVFHGHINKCSDSIKIQISWLLNNYEYTYFKEVSCLVTSHYSLCVTMLYFTSRWARVSQLGFREMSVGIPREIVIEKNKHLFLNLVAKINRYTEKYHSLLKRALTIIIRLLYLQLTDHANLPQAVDITIFMQGFPETWKLFQGFLQGKKIEKAAISKPVR
jgi:hypothetical protein